jgi:hypothetical protein
MPARPSVVTGIMSCTVRVHRPSVARSGVSTPIRHLIPTDGGRGCGATALRDLSVTSAFLQLDLSFSQLDLSFSQLDLSFSQLDLSFSQLDRRVIDACPGARPGA